MCSSLWICLWIVTFQGWNSYCDNAPPILKVPERTWELTDTELVDSIVTRVKADDDEDDPLVFGLEMKPALPGFPENLPLPLRIDNTTGVVYINDSLKGRAGESFSVYVTVTDGNIHAKTEVPVSIRGSGVSNGPYQKSSRPPRPGVASNYPPRGPPLFRPPGLNLSPPPPRPPRPTTDSTLLSVVTPTASREVPPSSVSPSTETPTPSTVTKVLTSTSPTPEGAPGGSNVTSTSAQEADLAVTVVPIVIVCALIGLGGLGAWLFRRRLFKYRMKTTTKDDLRKQSGSGGTILEDPMALQHWRGPRAHSNRYEGWDRETSSITQTPSSGPQPPGKLADRWEFPRHRLKVFNILGEGCFGQVWRCEAQDIDGNEGTSVVAVKTLKENANEKERSDLVQELQVMKMLEPHPNVVRLLGCCTEKDPLFVIMEFVPHGKLQSFLRSSRAERFYGNLHGPSNTLTSRDLTTFVYQVARGMEFLSAKGIIHRDLAARNVLVGENHVCKVADFGFARDVIANHVYERKSEGRLPIRWMAPESLYDNIFSVKSDVWSFGILIWEIVTLGSTPYPGLAAADVMKKVRDGYRLDKPEHCRRELYNIMYYCWDKDAKERPTFPELVQLLEQLLLSETEYIELERFPDHSYYNMVSLSGEKL